MKLKYLSPSSYHLYKRNPKQFYLSYIAGYRSPATDPMLLGTAFDVYVKAYLAKQLFGTKPDLSPLDDIPQHVKDSAALVLQAYIKQGAFASLLREMEHSISPPKFEFLLHNEVHGPGGSIPMKGVPDLYCTARCGTLVIYDWKVNGFYSNSTTSPTKGYVHIFEPPPKIGKQHVDCIIKEVAGIKVNTSYFDPYWANQLTIYSWLLGEEVGSESHVVGIDQLVCNPPDIRVAKHRTTVSRDYQLALWKDMLSVWNEVNSRDWEREYELIAESYGDDDFSKYVREVSSSSY